jgi:hypothetical protein
MYASNNDINGKKREERDIYIKISPSDWICGDSAESAFLIPNRTIRRSHKRFSPQLRIRRYYTTDNGVPKRSSIQSAGFKSASNKQADFQRKLPVFCRLQINKPTFKANCLFFVGCK